MNKRLKLFFFAALLVFAAPCLFAQDGLGGALSRANRAPYPSLVAAFNQNLASGDFDGDNKPDGAVLIDSGSPLIEKNFRIELHFSGRKNSEIGFDSAEKVLSIAARDVNRDGYLDVVVEEAITHKLVGVWLNDGHGSFREGVANDLGPTIAPHGRIEFPSQPPDSSALGLVSRRGGESGALLIVCMSPCPRPAIELGDLSLALLPQSVSYDACSPRSPPVTPAL